MDAVHPRLHRAYGNLQLFGDLAVGQVLVVGEPGDRLVGLGQPVQSGPNTPYQPRLFQRLLLGDRNRREHLMLDVDDRFPVLVAAMHIHRGSTRDDVKPWLHGPVRVVRVSRSPHLEQRLLHGVRRESPVGEHSVGDSEHTSRVQVVDLSDRLAVASGETSSQARCPVATHQFLAVRRERVRAVRCWWWPLTRAVTIRLQGGTCIRLSATCPHLHHFP